MFNSVITTINNICRNNNIMTIQKKKPTMKKPIVEDYSYTYEDEGECEENEEEEEEDEEPVVKVEKKPRAKPKTTVAKKGKAKTPDDEINEIIDTPIEEKPLTKKEKGIKERSEKQKQALERARKARMEKTAARKEEQDEMEALKMERDRLKMEKAVKSKVRSQLKKEAEMIEKRRILKEIHDMSDDDETILPTPRARETRQKPRVMSVDEWMGQMGF